MPAFKRFISLVFIVGSLCTAATSAYADASDAAAKYIQGVGDKALAVIVNQDLSKDKKQSRLERIFSENVDFPWVARFVMGQYWRQASGAQKAKYVKAYEQFQIYHYTARFINYTGGSLKVTGSRSDGDGEYTVSMQMQSNEPNGEPVQVEYRVRQGGGTFRIFDVKVEGVSMLTTQRSEFASVLGQHDIDYLIAQLQAKSKAEGDDPASDNASAQ